MRALSTNGCRGNNRPTGGFEFTDRGCIERMNRGNRFAIEGCVEFAPFAAWQGRSSGQAHRGQHRADNDRIGREHFSEQGDGRSILLGHVRAGNGPGQDFLTGIVQHRARKNILGLRMRRHAESRNIDTDHSNPVDLLRQELKRHARCSRDAQVRHDDRIQPVRVRGFEHRITNVFKQLTRHQGFRIEWHISNGPPCTIKMRDEGQPVHTTSRPG